MCGVLYILSFIWHEYDMIRVLLDDKKYRHELALPILQSKNNPR